MAKLTTLKPRLQELRTNRIPELAPKRNRDTRLRGSAWIKIRERIMRRDCGVCRCATCASTGQVRLAHEVDHLVPRWKWAYLHDGVMDGCEADENLAAINADCHREKTNREERERRALEL